MKRYADRNRREIEKWKKGDRIMLSTKDLVFKERPVCKLVERYVGPYKIEEVISSNVMKLQLPSSMRIYLVVNVSWIVWYKKQVKEQKKKEEKLVEVEGVEEWEVEKILNKRKENLQNAKNLIKEFEKGEEVEIR